MTSKQPLQTFPFDVVVVTSPDATAARAAELGPLSVIAASLPNGVQVLSTSDPFDARCGSGGGTLAALDFADCHARRREQQQPQLDDLSILIVHAGGQSSRCPTQMALGKAWTSLPMRRTMNSTTSSRHRHRRHHGRHGQNNNRHEEIGNPTSMLIHSLGKLFDNAPKGTVVVAASDVLISLQEDEYEDEPEREDEDPTQDTDTTTTTATQQQQQQQHTRTQIIDWSQCQSNQVIGLAVPAPLTTATNHGVYAIGEEKEIGEVDSASKTDQPHKQARIQPVVQFLQKPSIPVMRQTPSCTFINHHLVSCNDPNDNGDNNDPTEKEENGGTYSGAQEESAWIDTGVVAFLPQSAAALRRLAAGCLTCCTERGLKHLHAQEEQEYATVTNVHDHHAQPRRNLQVFSKQTALRVELYSHLMFALSTSSSATSTATTPTTINTLDSYLKSQKNSDGDIDSTVLAGIHKELSHFQLQTCVVPSGQFVHLGTTREMLDFMTHGASWYYSSPLNVKVCAAERQCRDFGRRVNLARRCSGSFVAMPFSATRVAAVVGVSNDEHTSNTDNKTDSFSSLAVITTHTATTKHTNTHTTKATVDPSCVVLNSIVVGVNTPHQYQEQQSNTTEIAPAAQKEDSASSIGRGTVIEHSSLICHAGIRIGQNCLLSGVRGYCNNNSNNEPIDIPDGMCLQMLPIKQQHKQQRQSLVYMYFGVNDDIKKCTTIYGMDMYYVLERSGLTLFDIWDKETLMNRTNTIWNAKIHPVVMTTEKSGTNEEDFKHSPLFSWITSIRRESPDTPLSSRAMESLQIWLDHPRLSLCDIREGSDALSEFEYRNDLKQSVIPAMKDLYYCESIRNILSERQHKECHLEFVLDSFAASGDMRALTDCIFIFDGVSKEALENEKYDVISRAFMVASALFVNMRNIANAKLGVEGAYSTDELGADVQGQLKYDFMKDIDILRSATFGKIARFEAFTRLQSHRNSLMNCKSLSMHALSAIFRHLSVVMEKAGLALIELCVSESTVGSRYTQNTIAPAPVESWVVASAPARVDLAGGWTDTPPLSYEFGGTVSCLAVKVDGKNPLSARCRIRSGGNGIVLISEGRDFSGNLCTKSNATLDNVTGLADFKDPHAECALMKCALVFFGLVPLHTIIANGRTSQDLQPFINSFCCSDNNVGLEIVSTSLLPQGSGMGSSSILGGCILAAIGRCIGFFDAETEQDNFLIQAVLTLEQLLSTGGGWQDQVGGLVGGLKLGRSDAHVIPLRTHVERIPIRENVRDELNKRLILAFTGQPRLAKNIVQSVLRRWAQRSPDIVRTVEELVKGAASAAAAVGKGDLDKLGECLNTYWDQKKTMAGENGGAEPAVVKELLHELHIRGEIVGGSLCGAGGGGFMVLLARDGRSGVDVQYLVEHELTESIPDLSIFTWYECSVSERGLTVMLTEDSRTNESFDLDWHQTR